MGSPVSLIGRGAGSTTFFVETVGTVLMLLGRSFCALFCGGVDGDRDGTDGGVWRTKTSAFGGAGGVTGIAFFAFSACFKAASYFSGCFRCKNVNIVDDG